jgi:hypothetical protein
VRRLVAWFIVRMSVPKAISSDEAGSGASPANAAEDDPLVITDLKMLRILHRAFAVQGVAVSMNALMGAPIPEPGSAALAMTAAVIGLRSRFLHCRAAQSARLERGPQRTLRFCRRRRIAIMKPSSLAAAAAAARRALSIVEVADR